MVTIICSNFGIFNTNETIDVQCHIFTIFFIMQTVSSYLRFIPLILNQFCPNVVLTYKIYSWTICVLCVVFKCQYFWSYWRKTDFWPFIYMYLFQRSVTLSKIIQLTRFIFYRFRTFKLSFCFFLFFESYHFLKVMRLKCQKTEFRDGHFGFYVAILDWQWVLFNPVLYTW